MAPARPGDAPRRGVPHWNGTSDARRPHLMNGFDVSLGMHRGANCSRPMVDELFVELRVPPPPRHQFAVRPPLDDPPLVNDQDFIGPEDGR